MSLRGSASSPLLRAQFDIAFRHSENHSAAAKTADGVTTISTPGLSVAVDAQAVRHAIGSHTVTLCMGAPRIESASDANPAHAVATALSRCTSIDGTWLRGRYLIVHFDLARSRLVVATDRFAVYPLCFAQRGALIFLSDRADGVPLPERQGLDEQSIFDYVYFHMIPAPRTIYRNVFRLPPSQALTFDSGGLNLSSTWRPVFKPDGSTPAAGLKETFREVALQAVDREVTNSKIGAFLSGGTDSSTVVGLLSKVKNCPAATFSIGFDAKGYDEIGYARIAARHFGADHHEYYVKPADLVETIPAIARHYEQPFGNSSVTAAFLCARLAREHGVEKLLAGDGGDELFGGNTRYARQKVFDAYNIAPAIVRRHLLESLLCTSAARRLPLVKKAASYVEQARVPMPERMETYNLLHRFGVRNVFTAPFLERVDCSAPLDLQRSVYRGVDADSLIDRMLAYDWRFTLSDNDVPKVVGSARLADESVGFPLLDDDLLDFSLRLAPAMKVKGLTLRYFFKEALRGFLPDEILRKRKHGFGLPFGPWLSESPDLLGLARSSLGSLVDRGLVREELIGDLFSARLAEHAGYYGELIWVLMMLEQWLQARTDNYSIR